MTDWTNIANEVFSVAKRATAVSMISLRDNITALAEQATGAPKIADKVLFFAATSGDYVEADGLDDFGGCFVDLGYDHDSGIGSFDVSFEVSDDGSTWYGGQSLVDYGLSQTGKGTGRLFLDFATGNYSYVGTDSNGSSYETGTVSGASLAITHIRFTRTVWTSIMVQPQGGASAS